ncbi:MAG: hypothetical protein M5U26_03475 [Planctomycetota bacterium]|nr:hypothetical protein [Planctomycetota bacterium]
MKVLAGTKAGDALGLKSLDRGFESAMRFLDPAVHLPERTLIAGAPVLGGLQRAGQALKGAPIARDVFGLFDRMHGVGPEQARLLRQELETAEGRIAAGHADALDEAAGLRHALSEVEPTAPRRREPPGQSPPPLEGPAPRPPEGPPGRPGPVVVEGERFDPETGEQLFTSEHVDVAVRRAQNAEADAEHLRKQLDAERFKLLPEAVLENPEAAVREVKDEVGRTQALEQAAGEVPSEAPARPVFPAAHVPTVEPAGPPYIKPEPEPVAAPAVEPAPQPKPMPKPPPEYVREGEKVRYRIPDRRFKKPIDAKVTAVLPDGRVQIEIQRRELKAGEGSEKPWQRGRYERKAETITLSPEEFGRLQPSPRVAQQQAQQGEAAALAQYEPVERKALRQRSADANRIGALAGEAEAEAARAAFGDRAASDVVRSWQQRVVTSVPDESRTVGRAKGLPKTISDALDAGVPADLLQDQLKSVDFIDADAAELMVGDKFKLGGDTYTVKGTTPEGKLKVKDGYQLELPPEHVPMDAGTAIERTGERGKMPEFGPEVAPSPALPPKRPKSQQVLSMDPTSQAWKAQEPGIPSNVSNVSEPPTPSPQPPAPAVKPPLPEIAGTAAASKLEPAAYTRERFYTDLKTKFRLPAEQSKAVLAIADARANTWARQHGKEAAEWYATRIQEVRKGELTPEMRALLQREGKAGARGAVEFVDEHKAIVHAFKNADVSTSLHELGHIMRKDLEGADLATVERWVGAEAGAKFTREQEETFARGFEKYLKTGKAPTEGLAGVFSKLKDWLTRIYDAVRGGKVEGVQIPDEVRGVYDRLLGGEGLPRAAPTAGEALADMHTPKATREAWQMTRQEYLGDAKGPDEVAVSNMAHAQHVKRAVAEGKPVPVEVLRGYEGNGWASKALREAEAGAAQAADRELVKAQRKFGNAWRDKPEAVKAILAKDGGQLGGLVQTGHLRADDAEFMLSQAAHRKLLTREEEQRLKAALSAPAVEKPLIRMEDNLLGEQVVADAEQGRLAAQGEQGQMFDNTLTSDAKRYRENLKKDQAGGQGALFDAEEGLTPQEKEANRKRWFGVSKVIDEAGQPRTVYHGTTADFDEFKRSKPTNVYGPGYYFTEDPAVASQYGGGALFAEKKGMDGIGAKVVPAHLRIEKPFITERIYSPAEIEDLLGAYDGPAMRGDDLYRHMEEMLQEAEGLSPGEARERLAEYLIQRDYDGIQYLGGRSGGRRYPAWVAFDNTQIKGKFNSGEYGLDTGKFMFQGDEAPSVPTGRPAQAGKFKPSLATEAEDVLEGLRDDAVARLQGYEARLAKLKPGTPEFSKLHREFVELRDKALYYDSWLRSGKKPPWSPEAGRKEIDAVIDRRRFAEQFGKEAVAQSKLRTYLEDTAKKKGVAVEQVRRIVPPDAAPEVNRAVTEYLEKGGKPDAKVAEVGDALRERYEQLFKLDSTLTHATPRLDDPRVAYAPVVTTNYGRSFLGKLGEEGRASFFVELEKARVKAGVKPDENRLLPYLQQKLDVAGRARRGEFHGIPKVDRGWAKGTLERLKPADRAFLEQKGLVGEFLAHELEIRNTHGSQLERLPAYKGLSIAEKNEIARKIGARKDIFSEDPAVQLYTRTARTIRAKAGDDFFKGVAARLGEEIPPKQAWATPDPTAPGIEKFRKGGYGISEFNEMRKRQGLPAVAFPDLPTAQAVQKAMQRLQNPEEVTGLLKLYDDTTRMLKSYVTRAFPAYHLRNRFSNRVQSWLEDVPVTGDHYTAAHKVLAGLEVNLTTPGGEALDRARLLEELRELRIVNNGFYEAEFGNALREKGVSANPFDPDNRFIKAGERTSAALANLPGQVAAGGELKGLRGMDAQAVEGVDRVGHYLYKRTVEGLTPEAAAESVKKALFDYGDLSDFEKKYMGRAVFFYTWSRKAVPMMLARRRLRRAAQRRQLARRAPGLPQRRAQPRLQQHPRVHHHREVPPRSASGDSFALDHVRLFTPGIL